MEIGVLIVTLGSRLYDWRGKDASPILYYKHTHNCIDYDTTTSG